MRRAPQPSTLRSEGALYQPSWLLDWKLVCVLRRVHMRGAGRGGLSGVGVWCGVVFCVVAETGLHDNECGMLE
jgi:hypothetical protein